MQELTASHSTRRLALRSRGVHILVVQERRRDPNPFGGFAVRRRSLASLHCALEECGGKGFRHCYFWNTPHKMPELA